MSVALCSDLRGSGAQWLSRRAGRQQYDGSVIGMSRGAGWRDNLRSFFAKAGAMIKRFILPKLKQYGPQVAEQMAKYALNEASAFAKRKNAPDRIQALVDQATADVPRVVADTLRRIDSETLRGSGPDDSEYITPEEAEAFIRQILPQLRELMSNRVLPKLRALERMGSEPYQRSLASQSVMYDNDWRTAMSDVTVDLSDEMAFLVQLGNAIIQSILAFTHSRNLGVPEFERLLVGAQKVLMFMAPSQDTALATTKMRMLTSSPNDEDDPQISSLKAVLPTVANISPTRTQRERVERTVLRLTMSTPCPSKTKRSEDRGGFLGAAILVPALAAGVPALASAISDIVHTWRGSGPLTQAKQEGMLDAIMRVLADNNCAVDRSYVKDIIFRAAKKKSMDAITKYLTDALVPTGDMNPSKKRKVAL